MASHKLYKEWFETPGLQKTYTSNGVEAPGPKHARKEKEKERASEQAVWCRDVGTVARGGEGGGVGKKRAPPRSPPEGNVGRRPLSTSGGSKHQKIRDTSSGGRRR